MTTTAETGRGMRVGVAIAIVVWTAISWGGRIGLLIGGESSWAWARIGGSAAIGLLAALAIVSQMGEPWRTGLIGLFVLWTVVLWTRSLVVNWMGDGSLGFRLVHTGLATGFFTLAWLAWRTVRTAN